MPNDFYMRAVVTVIAISLAVIAWKLPLINVGHAQLSEPCGGSASPCHIKTSIRDPLNVRIENASDFRR